MGEEEELTCSSAEKVREARASSCSVARSHAIPMSRAPRGSARARWRFRFRHERRFRRGCCRGLRSCGRRRYGGLCGRNGGSAVGGHGVLGLCQLSPALGELGRERVDSGDEGVC